MKASAAQADSGWQAHLRLGFLATPNRTILADRFRQGPLAVQRALYPEGDLCHLYLLHPPGGVAGGDTLKIMVDVGENAHALVTTPGATKFYRTIGPWSRQQQQLNLDRGSLEWLPQETILFPGARAELSTTVNLHADARFFGWEIVCLGRPAAEETFHHGEASFCFKLSRDGIPLLFERIDLTDRQMLISAAGLRGFPVFATLYATPCDQAILTTARAALCDSLQNHMAITLIDDLLVARYLGKSAETARNAFISIWQAVRPKLLGRPASPPRIWNT